MLFGMVRGEKAESCAQQSKSKEEENLTKKNFRAALQRRQAKRKRGVSSQFQFRCYLHNQKWHNTALPTDHSGLGARTVCVEKGGVILISARDRKTSRAASQRLRVIISSWDSDDHLTERKGKEKRTKPRKMVKGLSW